MLMLQEDLLSHPMTFLCGFFLMDAKVTSEVLVLYNIPCSLICVNPSALHLGVTFLGPATCG